jgi:D-xylose transport system substrate-binding protein
MKRRDAGHCRSVFGGRRLFAAAGAALVSAPLFAVPAAASSIDPRHVTARGFTTSSGAMDQFRRLAAAGHGPVGVLLPNSQTGALVGAALAKGLRTAGLMKSQFEVQNAEGSDATQLGDAETDIAHGSRVLLVDPINSGVGTQIEVAAQTKGVKTIDFDNLSLGGSRNYYVGYDQVTAGRLLVEGLASCSTAWHVARPRLLVLPGLADNGATSQLAQGYDAALQPLLDTHGWTVASQTAGTSDPPTAASEFQAAYAASQGANAALVSSDETDAAVIGVLQAAHVRPHTFPTTGIGSTLTGLQNVLRGYQCGTVAMPPVPEADAAIALALYLRAGQRPPSGLVNAGVEDTTAAVHVPAVLVTPQWVTASNMASTALKDGGVTAAKLCRGSYAAACQVTGIKP